MMSNNCICCGKEFIGYKNSKACSYECKKIIDNKRKKDKREKRKASINHQVIYANCAVCKIKFVKENLQQLCCSDACQYERNKERKRLIRSGAISAKEVKNYKEVQKCTFCKNEYLP